MDLQFTPYAIPVSVAAVAAGALAFWAWQHRPTPGATSLMLLMLAVAIWSLGYAFEMSSTGLPTGIFWAKVQYLGIAPLSVTWLAFALQYTNREKWLTRPNLALASIVPFITLLLAWTNEANGLIWSNVALNVSNALPGLDLTYGRWFWVNAGYTYLSLLLGSLLLLRTVFRSPHLYRRQASALLIGLLAPWAGNALYLSGLSPFPHLDLTPLSFTVTGLALAWGLFRFQLLDIVPVARDKVIDSMGDAVIVLDAQARVVDLNAAAARIIGPTASEAIGQPSAQVLSDWPDLVERYRDETKVREEIVLREGEVLRIYDLHLSSLYDRRDRPIGRLIVGRDVTERKLADAALARERRAFRIIAEASVHAADVPDLCHSVLTGLVETLGFEFGTIRLHDEVGSLLRPTAVVGLSEEEAREKIPTQALDAPKYLAALIARTRQAVFAPDVTSHKILQTHRARLDELGIRSLIGWPVFGAEQSLLGVIQLFAHTPREIADEDRIFFETVAGMFATVLERKQAEDALGWRATQLDTLNRIGRHVASILDRQELLQRAVDAVRGDLGYMQAAVLLVSEEKDELYVAAATDNFWEIIPDNYRQPLGKGAIGLAAETGETVLVKDASSDQRVYRVGDWLSPSSLSMPIRVGEWVIGVLEVEADVTDAFDENDVVVLDIMASQIAVAIENARLYEQAQQEIAERKRAEEALVQARDQAMEASNLKGRLLANVSHDLRSPLGSILGFTEMLQEGVYGPLSERQRTATAEITDSTERLLSFVNNLLGQAQIESGRVMFNFEPFDPAKLLEAIPSTARTLAKYKGLELIGEVAPDMPDALTGDLYWLRQIVVNLIGNAVRFTDQGTVKMRIYQVNGDHWAIKVSDTGCGIPAEARSYIFEPFRKVDETTTRKQQSGSGLGLSIVKQLTTMMGGEVTLVSEVEQGSTFTVLLPLTPVQEEML